MERRTLLGIGTGSAVLPAWWAVRQVNELDRDGYSTKLWFDRRSDTVRFRALDPYAGPPA
ncbi:hypothetical protein ACFZBU_07425 [Embleya sp. NPDC008237]|uniref:hypothetical protein n=1 Tax=Embleya sp. NPDC008237 TaxID=3363978 RepID=UPI0036F05785